MKAVYLTELTLSDLLLTFAKNFSVTRLRFCLWIIILNLLFIISDSLIKLNLLVPYLVKVVLPNEDIPSCNSKFKIPKVLFIPSQKIWFLFEKLNYKICIHKPVEIYTRFFFSNKVHWRKIVKPNDLTYYI